MMTGGDCRSELNPLIVAVDRTLIKQDSLTMTPNSQLKQVEFNSEQVVQLDVLSGMHRAYAAREASVILRADYRKIEDRLSNSSMEAGKASEDDSEDDSEDEDPPALGRHQALAAAMGDQMETIKEVMELVEEWPVQFYDIGGCFGLVVSCRGRLTSFKARLKLNAPRYPLPREAGSRETKTFFGSWRKTR